MRYDYDVIFAGGGLAAGLLAFRWRTTRPDIRLLVVERGQVLGGNHTWSFHETDIPQDSLVWLEGLTSSQWTSHEVKFPAYQRTLDGRYFSIRSEDFHRAVSGRLGDGLILGYELKKVARHGVTLNDGRSFSAKLVIDARGVSEPAQSGTGYQKFVGFDVTVAEPHRLPGPILMDANCDQNDGFHFFYTLPWSERTMLIESTNYSDGPELDLEAYQADISNYAVSQGWKIESITRVETGALPIPLSASFGDLTEVIKVMEMTHVPIIGTRAGQFHPTTGYSVADAVRMIECVERLPLEKDPIIAALTLHYAQRQKTRWFFYLLNRMLFQGLEPRHRFRMLEHFYRLPQALIERFYAAKLSIFDCIRFFLGRPPLSLGAAYKCLRPGVTLG